MELTQQKIREEIFEIADPKYKEFHSSLVPGCDTLIGVRVPVLRRYAEELLKKASAEELLQLIGHDFYEERMLRGMIITMQPRPQWEQVKRQTEEYVPEIDNWAICDTFCAGLKITKKHKEEMLRLVQGYLRAEQEFRRRFGVVMLLDYYIEEEYLETLFAEFEEMNREGYYVQMAVAWALSVCLVKYYEQTVAYLQNCNLDDFTYRKALQKARESYRLTPRQKETMKQMQRNISEKEKKKR